MADFGAFASWATPWAANWTAAMGRACWQGSVALFLAWLVSRLFPKLPASFQCWLWRLAYLKLFVALFWAVPVNLPLLHPVPVLPVPNVGAVWAGSATAFKPEVVSSSSTSSVEPSFLLQTALVSLWLCGMLWRGAHTGCEASRARSLRRQGNSAEDADLAAKAEELCGSLGLRHCPQLLYGGAGSPLLVGSLQPTILLPQRLWKDCTPTQQRLILAHELTHVRRGDLLWAWLPLAARCVFWFLPSVWLAEMEWQQSQEMACDEMVLRLTQASSADYGNVLLKVTLTSHLELPSELVAAHVANSYVNVKRRLLAMKQPRTTSRRVLTLAGSLAVLAGVMGILPWRVSAQDAPRKSGAGRGNSLAEKMVLPKWLIVDLNLTPNQITQAQSIQEASVQRVRRLLTPDQQKKLAGVNDGSDVRWERLGLTDAQQARMDAVNQSRAEDFAEVKGDDSLSVNERTARMGALRRETETQMQKIRIPEQQQQAKEQDWHNRATKEGCPYGLASLDRLGTLTPTQRNRIVAFYKETEKQMEHLLTSAQKQKLQQMRRTSS